jgi:hypothetical protein
MNQNKKGASDSTQRLLLYCQLQNKNSSETSQDIKNFSVFKTFIYLFHDISSDTDTFLIPF